MRIRRLAIKNFRNFQNLDVRLSDHAVIVGPNGVGKSNLLHALRLVLDPSLPDTTRQLRTEDFWDGVRRPLDKSARIEVVVELADFEENDDQLASLAEHLVEVEPMVARLTYVFRAKSNASDPPLPDQFEFFVFGGEREENRIGYEVRRRLAMDFFHALRDAESDLATWRRSPLKPLLDRAWTAVDKEDKEALAEDVDAATRKITEAAPLKKLGEDISAALARRAGEHEATDVQLGIGPKEAEALVRVVRLLLDNGRRNVGDASLGLANVLFFTLKLLELGHKVEKHERDHTFVAIEEPEAHLHPHLQRQMFRSFLRLRPHVPKGNADPLQETPATILVTTHSPHLASIAPIKSIVLLQQTAAEVLADDERKETRSVPATIATSTAIADLDPKVVEDLERYIEVTRAELLFARGVVLVEGEAETYLVPKIAELHGVDLDRIGISVCAAGGVHFDSYVRLLNILKIPFAVITDGDPDTPRPGKVRVMSLLRGIIGKEGYDNLDDAARLRTAREHGLFFGETTFEVDLLRSGRKYTIFKVLLALGTTKKARERAQGWLHDIATVDEDAVLKDLETIGKGRFAQRAATLLRRLPPSRGRRKRLQGPQYVLDAIDYVAAKVGS